MKVVQHCAYISSEFSTSPLYILCNSNLCSIPNASILPFSVLHIGSPYTINHTHIQQLQKKTLQHEPDPLQLLIHHLSRHQSLFRTGYSRATRCAWLHLPIHGGIRRWPVSWLRKLQYYMGPAATSSVVQRRYLLPTGYDVSKHHDFRDQQYGYQ